VKIRVGAALRRGASMLVVLGIATPVGLSGGALAIVKRAAGVAGTPDGLEGFVNAADALVTPAVVAMAAIAPLACIFGAGALMVGSRKGLPIVAAALGTLVFVASIKGIVA
jgi:hypothetical protein